MDIEEIKLICDTVSKLGDAAQTTLIWYFIMQLIPYFLGFGTLLVAIITIPNIILKANCPELAIPPNVRAARDAEIHAARVQAIREGKAFYFSPEVIKKIVTLYRLKYPEYGETHESAMAHALRHYQDNPQ